VRFLGGWNFDETHWKIHWIFLRNKVPEGMLQRRERLFYLCLLKLQNNIGYGIESGLYSRLYIDYTLKGLRLN
jgi:hypothetical protein